jgi:4-hydroxybutyrate CoA-transferase
MRCCSFSWIARIWAVHSELVSDGVIPLIEAGVLTGARKNFKPRKIILGFALGTKQLFDFRGQQSDLSSSIPRLIPTTRDQSPETTTWWRSIPHCRSILPGRSALIPSGISSIAASAGKSTSCADLRAPSEASRSSRSRPLPRTARSRGSCPCSSPGAGVVTSRGLIRYVVSEYGVAYSARQEYSERAQALIDIAHPKFREELYLYCEKTRWLQRPLTPEHGCERGEHGGSRRAVRSRSISRNARDAGSAWSLVRPNAWSWRQS